MSSFSDELQKQRDEERRRRAAQLAQDQDSTRQSQATAQCAEDVVRRMRTSLPSEYVVVGPNGRNAYQIRRTSFGGLFWSKGYLDVHPGNPQIPKVTIQIYYFDPHIDGDFGRADFSNESLPTVDLLSGSGEQRWTQVSLLLAKGLARIDNEPVTISLRGILLTLAIVAAWGGIGIWRLFDS